VTVRWRAVLLVVAIAAALLPLPQTVIESIYSTRLFPVFQAIVTRTSNLVPFALFDLIIVAVATWWLIQAIRDLRSRRQVGWLRAAGRIVVRTATVTAAAYLAFLLAWGLNYRRVPLQDKLQFERSRLSSAAALSLAEHAVSQMNAQYEPAHQLGWAASGVVDRSLADAFATASHELGSHAATVPGIPKRSLLDAYFRRAGVAGMTDPYFLETFVASDLLPFERPFVVAHEWGHLAGFADEGDANFLAWLTCLRGTKAHQYSGWLAAGPRDDLRAIRERLRQNINPQVSAAGWRVYDSYLKANNVEAGAASYADVVRLILGTTFADDWTPQLKSSLDPGP